MIYISLAFFILYILVLHTSTGRGSKSLILLYLLCVSYHNHLQIRNDKRPMQYFGGKTLSLAIYLEVNQSFKLGAPLKFWFARPVLQICAYCI